MEKTEDEAEYNKLTNLPSVVAMTNKQTLTTTMFIHLAAVAIIIGELTCWTVDVFSCDGRSEGVLISHGSLLIYNRATLVPSKPMW